MNGATTETEKQNEQNRGQAVAASKGPPSAAPTLESIVYSICLDAKDDSLKFVLRSDTGHDGE